MKNALVSFLMVFAITGCGVGTSPSSSTGSGTDVTSAQGQFVQFAFDRLLLPTSKNDYAIDLNGDGG